MEGYTKYFLAQPHSLLKEGENFVDLSTSLCPTLYNQAELQGAITACAQKVTKFRILLDKDANIDTLKKEVSWIFALQNKYPDTLKIANASEDIEHWILVDKKYFRIDAKHKQEGVEELRSVTIKNLPHHIAKVYIRQFDIWWINAEKVSL